MGIMTRRTTKTRYAIVPTLDPFQVLLAVAIGILLVRPERTGCCIRFRIEILHKCLRLIQFVHDRVVKLVKRWFHARPDVNAAAVLSVFVNDRLYGLRAFGMVGRGAM